MSDFLDLHRPGSPLLMPNAWDLGSASILESLGFSAIATTSSGFAATLGRLDGGVTRDAALSHGGALAAAVDIPVSADLERGFADDPDGVAATVAAAKAVGLAGCSVEDFTGRPGDPIYETPLAVERVAAAVEAAGDGFVITARAENLFHGRDLNDAIDRLQRFSDVGAHVLFAPGLNSEDQVSAVVGAVDRPVSVLAFPGTTVARLAELGVARISVGGSFAFAAYGSLVDSAREFLSGSMAFTARAKAGVKAACDAFGGQRSV